MGAAEGVDVGSSVDCLVPPWLQRREAPSRPMPFAPPGSRQLCQLHFWPQNPALGRGFSSCSCDGERSRPGCVELVTTAEDPLGHAGTRPPWPWLGLGVDGSFLCPRGQLWSTAWRAGRCRTMLRCRVVHQTKEGAWQAVGDRGCSWHLADGLHLQLRCRQGAQGLGRRESGRDFLASCPPEPKPQRVTSIWGHFTPQSTSLLLMLQEPRSAPSELLFLSKVVGRGGETHYPILVLLFLLLGQNP